MKIRKPNNDEDLTAWRAFFEACRRHHESLRGRLPEHALELLNLQGVDDGLLVEAVYERKTRTLQLTLRCGHLLMGYYDLTLVFREASLSPHSRTTLRRIAETTKGDGIWEYELYRFELDTTPSGGIILRLEFLGFYDDPWFEVRCKELQWHTKPVADPKLPVIPRRYREV
ncbi:MAG: hypothetical protein K6U12_10030 [Armatimonadetes bacterium]|nr:hypothetical protein [Armatimonadota bacterium]CUU38537.1 hypothetical protein DCOP10_125180 [Armatimonadetes bacterium DC]